MIDTDKLDHQDRVLLEAIQQADFLPPAIPVTILGTSKRIPTMRRAIKRMARSMGFNALDDGDRSVLVGLTPIQFRTMHEKQRQGDICFDPSLGEPHDTSDPQDTQDATVPQRH